MREYILTELERRIIHTKKEIGIDVDGSNTLRWRIRKAIPRLKQDLKLIEEYVVLKPSLKKLDELYEASQTRFDEAQKRRRLKAEG